MKGPTPVVTAAGGGTNPAEGNEEAAELGTYNYDAVLASRDATAMGIGHQGAPSSVVQEATGGCRFML